MTMQLPQPGHLTTEEIAALREENIRTYGSAVNEPLDSPSAHQPTEGEQS